jgi:hypothetical protein
MQRILGVHGRAAMRRCRPFEGAKRDDTLGVAPPAAIFWRNPGEQARRRRRQMGVRGRRDGRLKGRCGLQPNCVARRRHGPSAPYGLRRVDPLNSHGPRMLLRPQSLTQKFLAAPRHGVIHGVGRSKMRGERPHVDIPVDDGNAQTPVIHRRLRERAKSAQSCLSFDGGGR